MIRRFFFPGLLNTGHLTDQVMVVRDGFVNFYILKSASGLVCIDAGRCPGNTARGFEALGLAMGDVAAVFLTHLHYDHAGCARLYPNATVFVGEHEKSSLFSSKALPPLVRVRDGENMTVGGFSVRTFGTPGHTNGSVSYVVDERLLFVGDTLRLRRGEALPMFFWFNRSGQDLSRSIQTLAHLKGIEYLLTGHSGVTSDLNRAFSRWRQPATQPYTKDQP